MRGSVKCKGDGCKWRESKLNEGLHFGGSKGDGLAENKENKGKR